MLSEEQIREIIFWACDRVLGSTIRGKVNALKNFETLSQEKKLLVTEEKLQYLLAHASLHTPYYKKYNHIKELSQFPVVSKHTIAQNPALFYSTDPKIRTKILVKTSGSYGTPLTYYFSKEKKAHQRAEIIWMGMKGGFRPGMKHGYFRSVKTRSDWNYYRNNQFLFPCKFLDNTFAELTLNKIKENKIATLIGFTSAIVFLAHYLKDRNICGHTLGLKLIITNSEHLQPSHRKLLEDIFKVTVLNRYSTEELGGLGFQASLDTGFEMNTANYIIEVLDLHSDKPAALGALGRIVITDLHSDAMPLIRYETGDLGIGGKIYNADSQWFKSLRTLSGRIAQVLESSEGKFLYPLFLDSIMEKYHEVQQYQLIQKSPFDFVFNVVLSKHDTINHMTLNSRISGDLQKWLGGKAVLKINHVDAIKSLTSGKKPFIIKEHYTKAEEKYFGAGL